MSLDPAEVTARRRAALIERRRLRSLGVVVGLAVLAAIAVLLLSGGDDEPSPAATEARETPPPPSLDPAQLAGQRLIAGFEGTRVPGGLERMIAAGEVAGVILFADNISSLEDTARMTAGLQAIERPSSLGAPLAVMVDQEGGAVRRIPGPPSASAAEMGRRGAAFAAAQGRKTGRLLLVHGINVNLAPVLDVARPGSAIAAEGRSFGRDPADVIAVGVDGFAAAQREAGVAATAKHFPGLGPATTNTDLDAQRIGTPRTEIRRVDEAPFEAFVESGGELVMLSLASYAAIADRPAAFTREIATGELRGRLGFDGVSITDSLDAQAALAFGDRDDVALAAAGAGADLLLYGDWQAARAANETLRSGLERGDLDRDAFDDSVGRVLAMRAGLTPAEPTGLP